MLNGIHPSMVYQSQSQEQSVNGEIVHPDMNVPKPDAFGGLGQIGNAPPVVPFALGAEQPQFQPPVPLPQVSSPAPATSSQKNLLASYKEHIYPAARVFGAGAAAVAIGTMLKQHIKSESIRWFIVGTVAGTVLELFYCKGKE